MQRKSLSQLIQSLENLTGETIEGSENVINAGAVVDVIDYIESGDNINEMQQAALLQTKASEELGLIIETTEQLEDFIAEKTEQLENGVVTGDDVIVANEALAQACALYGLEKPIVCSFEDIGQDPKQALKVTLEGIGDAIANGFKAIIEWFKKLFAGIWKFLKGLFGNSKDKSEKISEASNELKVEVTEVKKDEQKINNALKEPGVVKRFENTMSKIKGLPPELTNFGKESLVVSKEDISDNLVDKAREVLIDIKKIGILLFQRQHSITEVVDNLNMFKNNFSNLEVCLDGVKGLIEHTGKKFEEDIKVARDMSVEEILAKAINEYPGAGNGSVMSKSFLDQISNYSSGLVNDSYTDIRTMADEISKYDNGLVYVFPDLKKNISFNNSKVEQTHFFFKTIIVNITIKNNKLHYITKIVNPAAVVNFKTDIEEKDFKELLDKGVEFVAKFQNNLNSVLSVINPSVISKIENNVENANKRIEEFVSHIEKYILDDELSNKLDIKSFLELNKVSIQFLVAAVTESVPVSLDVIYKTTHNMISYIEQLKKI